MSNNVRIRRKPGRHFAFIAIRPDSDEPYRGRCKGCPATASFTTADDAAAWCDEHDGRRDEREAWQAEQLRKAKTAGSN